MGIAYVFYLVALLQVSLCQDVETTDITIAAENSTLGNETTLASQDPSTEATTQTVVSDPTTTVAQEEESMSYQTDGDNGTSTSTDQPEPVSTSTSHPGSAASVAAPAGALAAALALCVRLFSSKLYGLQ